MPVLVKLYIFAEWNNLTYLVPIRRMFRFICFNLLNLELPANLGTTLTPEDLTFKLEIGKVDYGLHQEIKANFFNAYQAFMMSKIMN